MAMVTENSFLQSLSPHIFILSEIKKGFTLQSRVYQGAKPL